MKQNKIEWKNTRFHVDTHKNLKHAAYIQRLSLSAMTDLLLEHWKKTKKSYPQEN